MQALHDDEMPAMVFADVVNGADVRVVQGAGGAGLALQPLTSRGVVPELFWQELERDFSAEACVFSFIYHTHAAASQLLDDAIVGNRFADHVPPGANVIPVSKRPQRVAYSSAGETPLINFSGILSSIRRKRCGECPLKKRSRSGENSRSR